MLTEHIMLNACGTYTATWKAAFHICCFLKGGIYNFMLKLDFGLPVFKIHSQKTKKKIGKMPFWLY